MPFAVCYEHSVGHISECLAPGAEAMLDARKAMSFSSCRNMLPGPLVRLELLP
jgi:hypothetical protein